MSQHKTGKILTGEVATVQQILPHRNRWAWDLYLKGQANHWVPSEVSMSRDIEQWKDAGVVGDDERLLLKRCLGFFAGSESLVANNLLLAVLRVVSDPECRQYIYRQAFEEALHNHTIVYVCDSLGLDIDEVYAAHKNVPAIRAKDDFLMGITSDLGRPDFLLPPVPREPRREDFAGEAAFLAAREGARAALFAGLPARREVLRNLVTFYVVCEGIFFYSGFAMLLAFGRQNKLTGVAKQVEFVVRDESVHVKFGTQLIRTIVAQEPPELFNHDFKEEVTAHVKRAVDLEIAYVHDVLPRGVLGLNAGLFLDYMRYVANRRLEGIGIPPLYPNARNPFPWLAEAMDLPRSANFFETTVTNYSSGTLVDDL